MTTADIVIIITAITTAIGLITGNIISIIFAAKNQKVVEQVVEAVAEVHTVVNSKNDALVREVSNLTRQVVELKQDKANLAARP